MKQSEAKKSNLSDLIKVLLGMAKTRQDKELIATTLTALDKKYNLSRKISQEPGLKEITQQLLSRIYRAYGSLAALKGQRVLDIACGSNTSRAPSFVFVDTPFGERRIPIPASEGYTTQFEPWFCRMLVELGADAVGIDFGNLEGESFEHYNLDLGQPGVLSFLPDRSFDGVQDSRLFGSPEFTSMFPNREGRLKIAAEIWRQEQRLLKANGIIIHSDAAQLLR